MPKILYWDIENAPIIAATWQTYNINHIPPSHVIQDTFIISAQWKWEGGAVQSICSKGKDDTRVVKKMASLLGSADYAVAHNGDRHDWPVTLARMQVLGLPPINEPMFLDTLKMAKKAKHASRSLDYLCRQFQLPRKRETEPGLWLNAAHGDQESIKKIEYYGIGDIDPLEGLFQKLLPYSKTRLNRGIGADNPCCPACGGGHMQSRGMRRTLSGSYQAWQCQGCGKWSQTTPRIKKAFFK
jgi:hypothetical protein